MIKVILLSDKDYVGKIKKAFLEFMPDRLSVKCFTSSEDALKYSSSCDIFIADESFETDRSMLPEKTALAYFSEVLETYMINGEMALFIYQNINDIYNSIVNIIDCHLSALSEKDEKKEQSIFSFFSCTGGSGGSVFSKAFAVNKASEDKKVLYIPFEICTSANTVFTGEESLSLSDIFHDISLGKDETELKKTFSRAVTFDSDYKVSFIPPFYTINDIFSITEQQFEKFLGILESEEFSTVIIDADFSLPSILPTLIKKTDSIVMISNGTEHSNLSIDRMYNYISTVNSECVHKINIIYNRFVNGTSKIYTTNRINILGGIKKFSKSSRKYVIDNVSKSEVFSNLQ